MRTCSTPTAWNVTRRCAGLSAVALSESRLLPPARWGASRRSFLPRTRTLPRWSICQGNGSTLCMRGIRPRQSCSTWTAASARPMAIGNSHQFQANTVPHRPQHCLGRKSKLLSLHKPGFIWGMLVEDFGMRITLRIIFFSCATLMEPPGPCRPTFHGFPRMKTPLAKSR